MSAEADDDELLMRAGRGDRSAFAALVVRRAPPLTAALVRMLGDRALAEEIVQETFARAWREAPRFRAPGSGRTGAAAWLRRVGVNLALDHLRRPAPLPLDAGLHASDPAPTAEAGLIRSEQAALLRMAVARLPPRQRAALALAYDDAVSNAEGAAALGVSVGAFELLLVRARRGLREMLRPGPGEA